MRLSDIAEMCRTCGVVHFCLKVNRSDVPTCFDASYDNRDLEQPPASSPAII